MKYGQCEPEKYIVSQEKVNSCCWYLNVCYILYVSLFVYKVSQYNFIIKGLSPAILSCEGVNGVWVWVGVYVCTNNVK